MSKTVVSRQNELVKGLPPNQLLPPGASIIAEKKKSPALLKKGTESGAVYAEKLLAPSGGERYKGQFASQNRRKALGMLNFAKGKSTAIVKFHYNPAPQPLGPWWDAVTRSEKWLS